MTGHSKQAEKGREGLIGKVVCMQTFERGNLCRQHVTLDSEVGARSARSLKIMTETMRSSLVLPPIITSPQNASNEGLQLLSFQRTMYPHAGQLHIQGAEGEHAEVPQAGSRTCTASPSTSIGHSPASEASNPASKPSPLLAPSSSVSGSVASLLSDALRPLKLE